MPEASSAPPTPPVQSETEKKPSSESLQLFPERGGQYVDRSFFGRLVFGDESRHRSKCEQHVLNAVQKSPLVKLMMHALRSQGCPVDVGRHITCEWCSKEVTGGYDPNSNQIVVCYNRCVKQVIPGVLAHEMLHMFDHCRAHLDFSNVDHVACSEIRAANLMHCSILSGMLSGTVSLFNLSQAHARCVKQKALVSILASRPELDRRQGSRIIDKVFDKCYNDLEPVGRRIRSRSNDAHRAYRERFLYGYD